MSIEINSSFGIFEADSYVSFVMEEIAKNTPSS